MKLDNDVLNALRSIRVNGQQTTMPQLDRALYVKTNKALECLGGKWNKKAKAHLWDCDPGDPIADAVATGEVRDWKKELQFFPTPPELAAEMVDEARILHRQHVLEPSAGDGAILRVIQKEHGSGCDCVAVEINPQMARKLEMEFERDHAHCVVYEGDFLAMNGKLGQFDRILMNPPFTKGQDVAHVTHAWELLAPGGRLVAITAPGWTFRTDQRHAAFRKLVEEHGESREIPAGTFKASGTDIRTMLVILNKPGEPRQNAPRRADTPASAPTPAGFDWAAVKAHAPFSHPKIGDVWIDKLTPTHVSYTAFAGETPTGTRLAKVKWSRAEFEAGQEAAGPSKTRKRTVLTFHGVKAPPTQPSAQGGPLPRVRGKIPATQRLCELRDKLQALADRGINGEKEAAAAKLARLLARVDFSKPVLRTADLFAGVFVKANVASPVLPVPPEDYDVGNAVKYAIEKEAHIPCCWRADSLMAEAAPETANRLHSIAATVATSFRELWRQFAANPGVNPADRANFVAGLADGMLDEVRTGTALPARATPAPPRRKAKAKAVAPAPGLTCHPYSVATNLGRQIRFSVPLENIRGELDRAVKGQIA